MSVRTQGFQEPCRSETFGDWLSSSLSICFLQVSMVRKQFARNKTGCNFFQCIVLLFALLQHEHPEVIARFPLDLRGSRAWKREGMGEGGTTAFILPLVKGLWRESLASIQNPARDVSFAILGRSREIQHTFPFTHSTYLLQNPGAPWSQPNTHTCKIQTWVNPSAGNFWGDWKKAWSYLCLFKVRVLHGNSLWIVWVEL